jgi:general secretion pathway protein D
MTAISAPLRTALAALAWLAPLAGVEDERLNLLDLRQVPLAEALRVVGDLTGRSFAATPVAGKMVIDCRLASVGIEQAMIQLARIHHLWYEPAQAGGIAWFSTLDEHRSTLVDRREYHLRTWTILYPDAVTIAQRIEAVFGSRVLAVMPERTLGRTYLPGNIQANFELGKSSGDGDDSGNSNSNSNSNGGSSSGGSGDQGGGRRSREQERKEREVASEDARRLLPGGDAERSLAVLLRQQAEALLTVEEANNVLVARSLDRMLLDEIGRLLADLDRPIPQVLLEIEVLEVTLTDGFTSSFDLGLLAGPSGAGPDTTQPPNPLDATATVGRQAALGVGNGNLAPNALVYQYLNDQILARAQLLQEDGRARRVATPMLLSQNNTPAQVFVGEERTLVTNISSQQGQVAGSDSITSTVQVTTEQREIGTTLTILPRINAEGTVTLELVQEGATVKVGSTQLPVVTAKGLETYPIDSVDRAVLRATIQAHDGRALALGGLVRDELRETVAKVPWLGDIPWLGWLFRHEERRRERVEVVLIITPHVLRSPEEGERRSRERLRLRSLDPAAAGGAPPPSGFTAADLPVRGHPATAAKSGR